LPAFHHQKHHCMPNGVISILSPILKAREATIGLLHLFFFFYVGGPPSHFFKRALALHFFHVAFILSVANPVQELAFLIVPIRAA